ncbi:unnamed protein product [Arabidopsis halleri]
MDSGKTFDSIPNDVFFEIISRLSRKSIARCRRVSKLWASILCCQDFTELFLTKSSAHPRLLFAVNKADEWLFYSVPQSKNPSLEVDFHMKFYAGIDRQYMCSYASVNDEWVHHILTFGTEKLMWRKIQCLLTHEPFWQEICINGVLYYCARTVHVSLLIVCFDVRSEKFNFIDTSDFFYTYTKLVNYKCKLGVINLEYRGVVSVELCVWVLEDVEKRE